MCKYLKTLLLLISFSAITNCKDDKVGTLLKGPTTAMVEVHSQKLNDWFESEFQEYVNESPMLQTQLGIKTKDYGKWDDISSQKQVKDLEKTKKRLAFLRDSVKVNHLNPQTQLSYDLALQGVKNEIEDFSFRLYNYPVNQMHGMQAEIPAFLINMHEIKDTIDAKAYISRLRGISSLFNDLVENIKIREKNGIMPPKFVFQKVIEASRNVIKGVPFDNSTKASTLLADFTNKVDQLAIENKEKQELIKEAEQALLQNVQPAYQKLIATLEDQQKRATMDDGVWKFPKGKEFYKNALQRTTTTDMTAEEIHQLGLKEVERIHNEMRAIMKMVGFTGSLQDFFIFMKEDEQFYYPNTEQGKKEYLEQAVTIIDSMKGKLDELFITQPKADIVVKAVEPFREKSAGKAFYQQGTPAGSRPGKYYANLYDMKAMPKYQMEALAYHEGIPGHHMQISIAQELENIPKFRKFGGYTAYVEGWGLYNEFLPKEIGMYSDPYSDFGRLAMELWRAARLVVDTGIHAKKWTREEGINYYVNNTPNAESDAIKMVERHIVMPGQATAYKVGMNKILELREKAKNALEDDFDIREFHDVLLTNGAVPLYTLEKLVNEYIKLKSNKSDEV
ncbi:DUF885 domain-containing protein [Aquimarina sp. ERC-38]|uniref:DUF885 domain-containing protein n=1 Tax=Aquimarina sp. ERC-38 TaxID=2949996 RepID=UPI0022479850|nr:DUF885 domain-containing protein [Aquimarina sp. ERC-38]UZO80020.1 DUF885 domain-containing protein [Aquimarina sp. ERC-38]